MPHAIYSNHKEIDMVIYVDFGNKRIKDESEQVSTFQESVVFRLRALTNKADVTWHERITRFANGSMIWDDNFQRSFRKRLNNLNDAEVRSTLYDAFYFYMPEGGYKISSELSSKGLEYLTRCNFKKNGTPRKNSWGSYELQVIRNFSHFTFSGLYDLSENSRTQYAPVYRMYSTLGNWFEYIGVPFEMSLVLAHGSSTKEGA